MEVLEEAVCRYYGQVLTTTADGRAALRTGVDEALDGERGLSDELRDQLTKRLEVLDNKESYFLDLAAEERWPKDKLRVKIDAVRQETADIRRTIERADQRLDISRQIIHDALTLLDQPQQAYMRADESTRALLNKAFFTKLFVDGDKITGHGLHEPFDQLMPAYEAYTIHRTAYAVPSEVQQSGAALHVENSTDDQGDKVVSRPLTWWVSGSTKTTMVGAVICYSKHLALADDLGRCLDRLRRSNADAKPIRTSVVSTGRSTRQWRVSDRLSAADIAAMIARGQEGISRVKIADEFNVSHSTVKRILVKHGVMSGTGHYKRT